MLMNCFAGLFRKHCPLCKQEVQEQGDEAVQQLGKWFCSKMHADLYECELYEALRTVHCHRAGCHREHAPLPDAVGMSVSGQKLGLTRLREHRTGCSTPLP
jgi:hypothetical protein